MTDTKRTDTKARGLAFVGAAYAVAAIAAGGTALLLEGQHPLVLLAVADVVATIVVFAASVWSNNSSVYDPYWSVAPVPIAVALALSFAEPGASLIRQLLVVSLVSWWALRLTFNWIRRWRGLGDEDFRYFEMREKVGGLYWVVSFLGFHFMPTVTVFLGCLSLYPALAVGTRGFGVLDVVALIVTAAAVLIETISDRQLHQFVARKPGPTAIMDKGIWSWSRHPNYFGEVLFWWGLFLFGVAAAPSAAAFTWLGPVWMTCLFVFISIPLMDKRMKRRRPGYASHMRRVSKLVPWPPKAD
jgi:steroid 5-alpha reductase family enzyme